MSLLVLVTQRVLANQGMFIIPFCSWDSSTQTLFIDALCQICVFVVVYLLLCFCCGTETSLSNCIPGAELLEGLTCSNIYLCGLHVFYTYFLNVSVEHMFKYCHSIIVILTPYVFSDVSSGCLHGVVHIADEIAAMLHSHIHAVNSDQVKGCTDR